VQPTAVKCDWQTHNIQTYAIIYTYRKSGRGARKEPQNPHNTKHQCDCGRGGKSGSGQGENDETSAFAMAKYWISDSMKWIGDWMGRNGLEIGDFSETFCKRFACDYGALMPSVEGLYLALFWAFLLPGNTQGIKIRFAVLCPVKCMSLASQFLWFFWALSKASIKSDIPLNW